MLNDEEFQFCLNARKKEMADVILELRNKGFNDTGWGEIKTKGLDKFAQAYQLITGYEETNPSAIFHHVLSLYGKDCPGCKKPLRTNLARFCASCGFGLEELKKAKRGHYKNINLNFLIEIIEYRKFA